MAQLRWQKPADGSEAVAIAQIRWQRTSMTGSWCVFLITSNDHEPLIAHPGSMTQTVAFTVMIMGNPAAASPPRESRPPYWP